VFLAAFPFHIYLFDQAVRCPSQWPFARPFDLSAEDEYRGGFPVWSLHRFLIENSTGGILAFYVLWLPSASSARKSFFISWLRRSTGLALGWYIGVVQPSASHRSIALRISFATNWGPLSLRHTQGYLNREKNSRSSVSVIVFVVAVPSGYASVHLLNISVATSKYCFPLLVRGELMRSMLITSQGWRGILLVVGSSARVFSGLVHAQM